jgi:hypothetical protein
MAEYNPVAAGPDATGPFDHPVTYEDAETEDHAPGFVASSNYQSAAAEGDELPPLVSDDSRSISFSDSIRADRQG